MLKCRDLAMEASDYIEGELPWYRHLSMGLHLLMCGHCRRFVSQMRLTISVLRGQPVAAQGEGNAEQISKHVIEQAKQQNGGKGHDN